MQGFPPVVVSYIKERFKISLVENKSWNFLAYHTLTVK